MQPKTLIMLTGCILVTGGTVLFYISHAPSKRQIHTTDNLPPTTLSGNPDVRILEQKHNPLQRDDISRNASGLNPTQEPTLPLSRKDYDALMASGQFRIGKVLLENTNTVTNIRATGVIVMTREPTYVIIFADETRSRLLAARGITMQTPTELDHKYRTIKILVENKQKVAEVVEFGIDLWPPGSTYPQVVNARALDYQIEWLKADGFSVTTQ